MILGIMQPYFFPYIGYVDLINYTDRWVVFDTAQYIRHGWMNRNRILHPKSGWQYIIVPLRKHSRDTLIKDIVVSDYLGWKSRILGQIMHYRRKAPYFRDTYRLVEECMDVGETLLSRLNVAILDRVCHHLGISFRYEYFSEMNLELSSVEAPGDWALRIAEALGAEEYANPPSGIDLFDPQRFGELGIKLTIRNIPALEYRCKGYQFIPDLSIIDVLMWNPVERIKDYLDAHRSHQGTN